MKCVFSFLLLFLGMSTFAQQEKLLLMIRDQAVFINPDRDNMKNVFAINPSNYSDNDSLIIRIKTDSLIYGWNRSFFIYDSNGVSVLDFIQLDNKAYKIYFDELKKLLVPQQTYYIYSSAIPSNPQQAMLVKPGKKLVCAIKILKPASF
ncbi:MAG: hypothetical protein JST21_13330 [Bacteroidetes bacterium]|nr:hypothetical protein [Bacteroidota bacterium]